MEEQVQEEKVNTVKDSYLKMMKLGQELIKQGTEMISAAAEGLLSENDD